MEIRFQDKFCCPLHSHAAFAPRSLALATLLVSAPPGLCTPVGCGTCPDLIVCQDSYFMFGVSTVFRALLYGQDGRSDQQQCAFLLQLCACRVPGTLQDRQYQPSNTEPCQPRYRLLLSLYLTFTCR